jgi:hypothetical protein
MERLYYPTTVSIYREIYTTYIVRMEYLKIKSTRSADYYNVAQSDVRALVRGELTTLKRRCNSKSRAVQRRSNTIMRIVLSELL